MSYNRGGNYYVADAGLRVMQQKISSPAAANSSAVHGAVTATTGTGQTVSTGITNPDVPRCLSATILGTAGHVSATSIVINGTDIGGRGIQETLPAFTANTTGTVNGVKAFATVDNFVFPAQDGIGVNVTIGTREIYGLGSAIRRNTIKDVWFGTAKESTAATLTTSASSLSNNTIDISSTADGSTDIYVEYTETPT